MAVVNWIQGNWDLIGVVLGIVFAAVEVVRATGSLRQGILEIMLRAEKAGAKGELGDVTGPAIMDLVVKLALERLVPRLPVYVRPFITETRIRSVAQWVYDHAKEYLENGKLIGTGGEPTAPPQD